MIVIPTITPLGLRVEQFIVEYYNSSTVLKKYSTVHPLIHTSDDAEPMVMSSSSREDIGYAMHGWPTLNYPIPSLQFSWLLGGRRMNLRDSIYDPQSSTIGFWFRMEWDIETKLHVESSKPAAIIEQVCMSLYTDCTEWLQRTNYCTWLINSNLEQCIRAWK